MELHRIGVKFFASDPASIRLENIIPVFHGWIQKQILSGHMLIDVHDYSHMHQGPGILLVAHEGNVSIDMSDGRPGLMYYRKIPSGLAPVEQLTVILQAAIQACRLLEKDGQVRFDMNDFMVFANDRLNAPNNDQTLIELRPDLNAALKQVFEGTEFQVSRTSSDSRERFTATCRKIE
jgi:hypothetical protein